MSVYVMISVRPAGRPIVRVLHTHTYTRKINLAIFSNTLNMIIVTLCMMIILIELYPFMPLSVTLIVF